MDALDYQVVAKEGDTRWLIRIGPLNSNVSEVYDSEDDSLSREWSMNQALIHGQWEFIQTVPADIAEKVRIALARE